MEAYVSRGVSATKEEVHKAISAHDKGLYPGAFCKIVDDLMGDKEYCSIMHTDDAGTKATVAYILYKELENSEIFKGIAVDSAVMNLDDMICVGAVDNFIFSNTIGRNAHRIGGDAISALINGYVEFCEKMKAYGINITMCGGETSDTGDIVATVFIDSTFFARLKKSSVIDCANIKAGDVILGLASFGKAVYEDKYNSGIGSNGLTAARHIVLSSEYREKYPETFSSTIKSDLIYSGKHKVTDMLPETDITVGEALLSPTRTYAPIIKDALELYADDIRGIIHCTGGGQTKCRNFGQGLHYIKDSLFETPPIFKLIGESGLIGAKEMYQVFNMGHRMELFCGKDTAEKIIDIAKKYNIDAKIIGRVESLEDKYHHNKVTITDNGETHSY